MTLTDILILTGVYGVQLSASPQGHGFHLQDHTLLPALPAVPSPQRSAALLVYRVGQNRPVEWLNNNFSFTSLAP